MPRTRANLILAVTGCAWVCIEAGCMAPWTPPTAQAQAAEPGAAVPETSHGYALEVPAVDDERTELNLAGVLDKLQQVRAIDPAAEQKLIEELRKTPADSWPLVAEQFRASLAYREQLAAGSSSSASAAERSSTTWSAAAGIGAGAAGNAADQARGLPEVAGVVGVVPTNAGPEQPKMEPMPAEMAGARPADRAAVTATAPPTEVAGSRPVALQQAVFEAPTSAAMKVAEEPGINERAAVGSAPAEADWQRLVEQAAESLGQQVSASPASTADVHRHVSLRMLRLLAGDSERALEPIPHIPPAEQDYWSRQIFALATYLDHHSQPDDKRRAAATVTHLDEAVSHLRELGSLSLRNLSFCKNVYGYGAIEPYEDDRFAAGEQVSLYVEVENYHSQSTEKGFCTILGSSYELADERGERAGGGEFPDVEDYCRSRRRDFHIQYGVTLPANLSPGRYELRLVVKDRQSDKMGHATATFEIGAARP
jgi:hypothetical protein